MTGSGVYHTDWKLISHSRIRILSLAYNSYLSKSYGLQTHHTALDLKRKKKEREREKERNLPLLTRTTTKILFLFFKTVKYTYPGRCNHFIFYFYFLSAGWQPLSSDSSDSCAARPKAPLALALNQQGASRNSPIP